MDVPRGCRRLNPSKFRLSYRNYWETVLQLIFCIHWSVLGTCDFVMELILNVNLL